MNSLELFKMPYSEIKKEYTKIENYFVSSGEQEAALEFAEVLKQDSRKNVSLLGERLIKHIIKYNTEIARVKSMYDFDKSYANGYIHIAGVDEVGRGPLAGPIVAASVILNLNYKDNKDIILGIKDSKKLSPKLREELAEIIKEKALSYNIALINNDEIDSKGISWSNNEVLKRAALGLKLKPDFVISDGYAVKNLNLPNDFMVKGDAKSASIACSSIIAKVYRDNLMKEYSKIYPEYGFENNAGYGTKEHMAAIFMHGPCKLHRLSFLKNFGY